MKIFISHTKQDNDLAQIIVGALEKFKVDHWVDFDQLEKGDRLIRKINDGLKTSTHFMLIWTKRSVKMTTRITYLFSYL